tara:strand:- start:6875 stop:7822 length:948 start_codon:yes stop_codon:yes gene_type:complete
MPIDPKTGLEIPKGSMPSSAGYTYNPNTPQGGGSDQPFTGTVGSLGFGNLFEGTTLEDDWQQYFDAYDPAKEELTTRMAGIDVGQLQSAWDLQSTQLGETWDLTQQQLGETWGLTQQQLGEGLESQRGQIGTGYRTQTAGLKGSWEEQQAGLGTQARRGFQQADLMGEQMQRRGKGLTFGGQRQRQAESEVERGHQQAFGMGQSAYERAVEGATGQYREGLGAAQLGYEQQMARGELGYQQQMATGQLGYGQAMESGQLALQQGTTDIYQGLEQDVFGIREAWQLREERMRDTLLGQDIYNADGDNVDDRAYEGE